MIEPFTGTGCIGWQLSHGFSKGKTMSDLSCKLLSIAQVSTAVCLGKTAIYERMKEKTFPAPVSLGSHCVRWRSDQIAAWINAQVARPELIEGNAKRAKNALLARNPNAKSTAVELASHV